jgi:hypothetical protein
MPTFVPEVDEKVYRNVVLGGLKFWGTRKGLGRRRETAGCVGLLDRGMVVVVGLCSIASGGIRGIQ